MDFNDIKRTWKNTIQSDQHLNKHDIETRLKIKSDSNTALNKVKRNYKIELYVSSILAILFMAWIYMSIPKNYKYLLILATVIFFGVLISFTRRNYKRIKHTVISSDQLKSALVQTIHDIEKYVDFNRSNFTKYLLMPFAISFGMIIGLLIGAGDEPLRNIFALNEVIKLAIALVIMSGIFIPFSQYLTKKMYKQHLDELKQCLQEFQEIEH
ncbi:MAG: hypothetical protein KQH79_14990 [Bacteroidetes bacterium]|nr:hypothetical protein [Bacteroidota bacterium]